MPPAPATSDRVEPAEDATATTKTGQVADDPAHVPGAWWHRFAIALSGRDRRQDASNAEECWICSDGSGPPCPGCARMIRDTAAAQAQPGYQSRPVAS